MIPSKSITIVGGGLAGLTAGIGLRQRGVPVTIWEAGNYPRHRVCGEFISGRGQDVLIRLGLNSLFEHAGAVLADTVVFSTLHRTFPVHRTPRSALCLSRYAMDALLAAEFRRLGGELRVSSRWAGPGFEEGVLRATGRRPQPAEKGWRWFGLKVHARGVRLAADLEMHVASGGYVGVGVTSGGAVNVCGLFRRRAGAADTAAGGLELLRGKPGSVLWQRLGNAVFEPDTFCSVAGLSLSPRRASGQGDFSVGDSVTMTPPVTGNGMSMAFESAELALDPLTAWSRGVVSWEQAQKAVAGRCDRVFGRRLFWARVLQWLVLVGAPRSGPFTMALNSDWIWQRMFRKTR